MKRKRYPVYSELAKYYLYHWLFGLHGIFVYIPVFIFGVFSIVFPLYSLTYKCVYPFLHFCITNKWALAFACLTAYLLISYPFFELANYVMTRAQYIFNELRTRAYVHYYFYLINKYHNENNERKKEKYYQKAREFYDDVFMSFDDEAAWEASFGENKNAKTNYSYSNSAGNTSSGSTSDEDSIKKKLAIFGYKDFNFTQSELKKKRNQLIKRYHSDNTHDPTSDLMVMAVNKAYSELQKYAKEDVPEQKAS